MSKYSVRKPITVLMGMLIIIVLGILGLTKMSMGLFPNMELPYMIVVTPYVGADAETVYDEVTSKIESKVSSISNYNGMSSTSSEHYSMVMIEFLEGTNMDKVMVELREELNNIDFIEGVDNSTLMQISPDMLPVMSISMSVDYEGLTDEEELIKTTEFINKECMDKFNAIPGVAEVSLTGAAEAVLQINLDPVKLATLGYSNSQILELIQDIQKKKNLSVIYITHDLGVVAKVADYVNVMYAGKIIETGTIDEIFFDPRHPYTWGLLSSMPDLDTDDDELYTIPGTPPNLAHEVKGDAFAPRNQYALNIDLRVEPPMFKVPGSSTHKVASWLMHEKAPKVEMPESLQKRIENMKKEGLKND